MSTKPWAVPDDWPGPYGARFEFDVLNASPRAEPKWGEVLAQVSVKQGPNWAPRYTSAADESVVSAFFDTVVTRSSTEQRMQDLLTEAGISAPDLDVDAMTDDQRELVEKLVALREGQQKFRKDLIAAYGACAVTGTTVSKVLDAAHVSDYKGLHTQHVANGVLLRTDLHRLFDAKLVTIEADSYELRVSPDLVDTPYWPLDGQALTVPGDPAHQPDRELLAKHNHLCAWLTG